MRRVAGGAVGRNDEPFLQEPLGMNAFRIILENSRLRYFALSLYPRSFLVTTTADKRNLYRGDDRLPAPDRNNGVAAVT